MSANQITLDGEDLELETSTHLGSNTDKQGEFDADMKARTDKGSISISDEHQELQTLPSQRQNQNIQDKSIVRS